MKMEEEEVFDLANMNEYDLVSNEDGTVLIQDNCVVIRHKENQVMKLLPLSEEVLQALGLALVLDEEDTKEANAEDKTGEEAMDTSTTETILGNTLDSESLNQLLQETHANLVAESAATNVDPAGKEKEGITIVFTDDEDGEGNTTANTSAANAARDKSLLVWTNEMVNHLLDQYEKHQHMFTERTRKPAWIWKQIHMLMCLKYPQLKKWNEQHMMTKFKGLQRTYKGAIMYWKENLHQTNWVHFERMHKLMNKQSARATKPPADEESAAPLEFKSKPDESASQYFASSQWKPTWMKLTLDAIEKFYDNRHKGILFWAQVRDYVISQNSDFEVVPPECLQRKFYNLKKTYKQITTKPMLKRKGEFADKYFSQRLMKLFDKLEDSDAEEEEGESRLDWSNKHTNKFLDLCYEQSAVGGEAGEGGGQSDARLLERAGAALRASLALPYGTSSHAQLLQLYSRLRQRYRALAQATPPSRWGDIRWPHFKKCQRLFQVQELWDAAATRLLLTLYGKVRLTLDESGARFWSELAERFNKEKPNNQVTPRKCEVKMNSLITKYKALVANMDDDSKKWPYFDAMHELFGSRVPERSWPTTGVHALLAAYQRHLPRFEEDDPERVWRDITRAVADTGTSVTVEGVKQKMLELKDKYGKLLKDQTAASQWVYYKRMSSIFSCHLWSKHNVNILLDAYEENMHRFDTEDAQAVWHDIKSAVNARSVSSAVSAAQCRTELHVLRARYCALRANVDPANIFWPFYQRMDQIFGQDSASVKPLPQSPGKKPSLSVQVEVDNVKEDANMDADKSADSEKEGGGGEGSGGKEGEVYEWSEDRVSVLLDLLEQHRERFQAQPRRKLWAHLDRELAGLDPTYRPGIQGYGGWFQYLDLMSKYMDVKERRCDHPDWPFYERMDKIFTSGGGGGSACASVASRDSIADKLQELLTESPAPAQDEPSAKRKREESESDANLSSTFSEDAETVNHSTPVTRSKRTAAAAAGAWSENESIQLIASCIEHKTQLQGSAAAKRSAWSDIRKEIQARIPKFSKSVSECEEKLAQLRTSFSKNKRFGTKLASAQRMPPNIFKKMEELIKAESEPAAPKPRENGNVTPPSTDLQQKILHQLEVQNELRRKREDLLKRYQEQTLALLKEKNETLNKILEAVTALTQSEKKVTENNTEENNTEENNTENKEEKEEGKEEEKMETEAEVTENNTEEYNTEKKEVEKMETEAEVSKEKEDKLKALVETLQDCVND